jgi:hypothetical protein
MEKIGHTISAKTLSLTYIALLVLAGVMIGLSRFDVSILPLHDFWDFQLVKTLLIMGTGTVMGIAIATVLMGLGFDNKFMNITIFASNFFFLLIFVLFTWVDTSFRGEMERSFTEQINWTSPVKVDTTHSAESAHAE